MKRITTIVLLFFLVFVYSKTNGKLWAQSSEEKFVGALSETLGYQSASSLFVAYIAIGSLADGFGSEAYSRENIMELSQQLATLMKGNHEQFKLLLQEPLLDENDRKMVNTISEIYATLSAEASSLNQLAKTGEKKYLKQYERERKKAWNGISRMLELN